MNEHQEESQVRVHKRACDLIQEIMNTDDLSAMEALMILQLAAFMGMYGYMRVTERESVGELLQMLMGADEENPQ